MGKNLSQETAERVWNAHREIQAASKLKADMADSLERGDEARLKDAFGRRRNLQLGIPSGENSHRLFDVDPALALHVIDAHVAKKEKELADASIAARLELGMERVPLSRAADELMFMRLVESHNLLYACIPFLETYRHPNGNGSDDEAIRLVGQIKLIRTQTD